MTRKLLIGVVMFLVLIAIASYATTPSYMGTDPVVTRPHPGPPGPPGPPVPAPPGPIPPLNSMTMAINPPDGGYPFYVAPGYTMLRKPGGTAQMYGKVVIDMRNGDIWGFPTLSQSPYPIDSAQTKPPKSSPMYLGRFMFNEALR